MDFCQSNRIFVFWITKINLVFQPFNFSSQPFSLCGHHQSKRTEITTIKYQKKYHSVIIIDIVFRGLLPSEERQDFKQKQNKETNSIFNIAVNDKVQLRKHLPGFPGALVFKPSETYGPQLGRLLSHETDGTLQGAVKIKVEKIPAKPGEMLWILSLSSWW